MKATLKYDIVDGGGTILSSPTVEIEGADADELYNNVTGHIIQIEMQPNLNTIQNARVSVDGAAEVTFREFELAHYRRHRS